MSNQAKDWQEGSYTVRVMGNLVEASKVYKDKVDGHICYKKSSAQAKCDPEDEFSLSMGVALAMDRLNKNLNQYIKVGDKVKITSIKKIYRTYSDWVVDNVKNNKTIAEFAYNSIPCIYDNNNYKVIAIAPHGDNKNITLAYIQNTSDFTHPCYLIDINGLEKV